MIATLPSQSSISVNHNLRFVEYVLHSDVDANDTPAATAALVYTAKALDALLKLPMNPFMAFVSEDSSFRSFLRTFCAHRHRPIVKQAATKSLVFSK